MNGALEIKEQPKLPIYRELEITASGIHHRLLRSVITLSIVVLAVAFLMNTLTESFMARSCRSGISALEAKDRELARLLAFFGADLTGEEVQKRLAELPENSWQIEALAPWLGKNPDAARKFHRDCVDAEAASEWLDQLKIGQRRQLFGKMSNREALAWLTGAQNREEFIGKAREIPLPVPQRFVSFVARYGPYLAERNTVVGNVNKSLSGLRADLGDTSLGQLMTASADDGQQRARLEGVLQRHGVIVPAGELSDLTNKAKAEQQGVELLGAVSGPEAMVAWAKDTNRPFEQKELLELLSSSSRAQWFVKELAGSPRLKSLDAAGVQRIAGEISRSEQIRKLEGDLITAYGKEQGMGAKAFWLIVVSLMVCVAGITNAMLISVIERFREIATMKCLGALDSFIAKLFLLEAAFLGLIGGVIGVALGLMIGGLRMFASYGNWVWKFFPAVDLLGGAGISILCGLGLATLAAIYPSYAASRMPPMEAMRVE
jgi:hypothetical protein